MAEGRGLDLAHSLSALVGPAASLFHENDARPVLLDEVQPLRVWVATNKNRDVFFRLSLSLDIFAT